MSTLEQLVDRVDTLLHGYSLNTESTTWLTSTLSTSATSVSVNDASVVSRGFIQIDDEIMYVASTNSVENIITLAPWGRAQRGSKAASHATNTKVVVAPLFPRYEIKKAINNTIDAMYPNVFAVGQYEFSYIAARTTYDVPDEIQHVLSVTHSVIGPSKEWLPVRAWQIDRVANPTAFGDGTITQEYSTVTGMPSYSEDVVVYGAAWRMISFLDPSRLGPLSAEADVLDNQRGARSGENAARFLYNIYTTRLNEVAENQRRQYPIRSHYQR